MRVVLAEDLSPLRAGLTRLLTAYGFQVAAAVGTGDELREALTTHRPDMVIAELRLPPTSTDEGLRIALAARHETPGLPVLLLSQRVEPSCARELVADGPGGVGYLLKTRVFDDNVFVEAVRRVAGGGIAFDPRIVDAMLAGSDDRASLATLTRSEGDVLSLLAEGRSYAAIAQRLFLSVSAVAKNTESIFAKLGLRMAETDVGRTHALLGYLGSVPAVVSGDGRSNDH